MNDDEIKKLQQNKKTAASYMLAKLRQSQEQFLTEQEIQEVENLVNEKIKQALLVIKEEMPLKKAIESGAQAEFAAKYPEKVSVYTIKDSSNQGWFSKEICTGPHVSNTKEIGKFKIAKEESSAAGTRRIKAILED